MQDPIVSCKGAFVSLLTIQETGIHNAIGSATEASS